MFAVDIQSVFDSGENRMHCAQCNRFFKGPYVNVIICGYPAALCSNACIQKWYAPERSRNAENAPSPLPVILT